MKGGGKTDRMDRLSWKGAAPDIAGRPEEQPDDDDQEEEEAAEEAATTQAPPEDFSLSDEDFETASLRDQSQTASTYVSFIRFL